MLTPHTACDLVISRLHYPLLGFPKLDGVRLINLTGQAVGRSLLPFKNKFTTAKFSKPEYLGLDGEATLGVITSSSLCRDTTSAVNTIEKEPNIVWMVFDFLINEVIDLPFIERYNALKCYLDNVKPESTEIIQYTVLNSTADLLAYYDTCLKLGYEGIIVRDPNGMHKNGRCNINEGAYMRLKPSSDKEAKVLSIIEAQKNSNPVKRNALGLSERSSNKINKTNKGMIGVLICEDLLSKEIIKVNPGKMSHKERVEFFNNPELIIDKIIKYRSLDKGIKDAPRFARYLCIRSMEDMENYVHDNRS